jgi:hypothetical protein
VFLRELRELAHTSNPYFSLILIKIRAQTNCSRLDQLHQPARTAVNPIEMTP